VSSGRYRRIWRGGAAVTLVLALSACGPIVKLEGQPSPVAHVSTMAPTTTAPPPTEPSPPPDPTVDFTPAVHAAVDSISDGQLSLAIFDRDGDTMVASYHPDELYFTESVVKLLIGLDSLDRGGSAGRVAEMLSRSDDNTATHLWDADGGRSIVTRMAAKIGLHDTVPPSNPGEWGDTRTTADDLVLIYQYILGAAPASERAVVLAALHNATNLGADGTDQYFGIPYGVGHSLPWAVKQGWACCEPGWVLNTTGLVGPDYQYIVIVLTSHDNGGGSAVRATDSDQLTDAIKKLLPDLSK
jgi:hypothetical protein